MLDIGLAVLDCGIEPVRQFDHARGEIDANRSSPTPQRGGGNGSRTARNVQDPHAGRETDSIQQRFRRVQGYGSEEPVVAR
jgi:hypothetical protein